MLLKNRFVMLVTAVGLGLSLGWVLAAQEASGPQWKDRAEYDLAVSVDQQKSPQDALKVLTEWETKYPQSDFVGLREDAFLAIYKQMNDARKAFDMAKKIRSRQPENLLALDAAVTQVYALGATPPAADLTYAEQAGQYILGNLNKVFAAPNKPRIMDDAAFAAYRPTLELLAQRIVAFAPYTRNEWAKAETEIRKFLAMDSSQALFSQMLGKTLFEQRQVSPDKQPNAMYHFARAAAYTGKNALPEAARKQMLDYVRNIYVQYHGSDEGFDQLLATAKDNIMPRPGFAIASKNDIERAKIEEDNKWKAEHPDLAFWRDLIRTPLQAPDGPTYWDMRLKDAGLPGDPSVNGGVSKFTGTIITSVQEKGKTKQVVVGVFDPAVPDATLDLVDGLPGMMEPGSMIRFSGTAKSYVAMPFNLTFETEAKEVEGWAAKGK